MTGAGNEVLRAHLTRLRGPAPAPPAPVTRPPDLAQLAAVAAGRAGEAAAGLALQAQSVTPGRCSLAELLELLPERPLLAVVEADRDRLGVVALSPDMLAALIEVQACGRVGAAPPEQRRPTRADAALASDFINALLAGLGAEAMRLPGEEALVGFRYASHLADPQALGLMLEDRGFRSLQFQLALGTGGLRQGEVFLALPQADLAPAEAEDAPEVEAAAVATGAELRVARKPAPRRTLAGAMRTAPVPLTAVLCRRRIALAELRALAPGTMLALPRHALNEVRLETDRGHLLARARLGEADGFHALCLQEPDSPPATTRLRDPLAAEAVPAVDLDEPDAFRPQREGDAVQNWQHALAETPNRT